MSHIPVVLLTALGDEKHMLEGLEIGRMLILPNLLVWGYSKQRLRTY